MLQRIQPTLVFLFGTPRRALYSVIGILVVIAICYPHAIMWVIGRILLAVSPLITIAFVGLIVFLAFRMMFGGFKLPKPKGDGK